MSNKERLYDIIKKPIITEKSMIATTMGQYTFEVKEDATKVENALNKAFNTKIRESVACREAISLKAVPLAKFAPNSNTCVDYQKFTDELLEVING